ncbi:MAG: helix-turn-helix transcriptional regulator [Burkholderiaceae bacterium]
MPNIASVLKAEIARVARKEIRAGVEQLKKASSAYRSDIAALKRRCQVLEQQLRSVSRGTAKAKPAGGQAEDGTAHRFSAKGLASHRRRLGLSASDFGLLVGASGQSIYKWEEGTARPRARNIEAIAQVRTMGKREVAAKLAELR